jgi:protein-disulfide isomerase
MARYTHEAWQRLRHRTRLRRGKLEPADALGAARESRSDRLRRLASLVVVVVVALAVIVLTAGGSPPPPKPGSARAAAIERGISSLLAGIPQNANTLGRSTAPVTLKWYGDLECPFCKEFALGALPSIVAKWVRGGELKIEYLSMQTATRNRRVFETQQVAALAAGVQDKMWNFIETFYHEQGEEDSGYVTNRYLTDLAGQIPRLDLALWNDDRFDPALAAQVAAERSAATRAHLGVTPTFQIGRSNRRPYRLRLHTLTNPRPFDEAIEFVLR